MSIQPCPHAKGTYLLSCERGFLEQLDEVELSAVIAHEIGHLWIYTHHPYLQTEALANRIALKLVGRQALASAYRKLWDRTGEPGDLDAFLGK